jgi:F-type H+-transporting ATPase subunit b
MGAFFDAFQVDVWKLAFQVINFLILLYLLNRFLFKPVLARLDERSSKISKGLEDAETADRELARAEREAAVSEARKEASNLIANANKIATDTRNEILAEARAQAEKVTERARQEIVAEKDRAMAELRAEVANLALDAAGKLVRSEMDGPTQRRLVEEFLAESRSGNGGGNGKGKAAEARN